MIVTAMKNRLLKIFICIISLSGFASCGLEAFYFLDNIPSVNLEFGRATIRMPTSNDDGYDTPQAGGYFSNFLIFYRIYISDDNPSQIIYTDTDRIAINSTLNSDWNSLYSFTKENISGETSNMDRKFLDRNYYKLELEGNDIDKILDRRVLQTNLIIDFSVVGEAPTLIIENSASSYTLKRTNNKPGLTFFPEPSDDWRFFNFQELRDPSKALSAVKDINADVVTKTNPSMPLDYTYVSMYIVAAGKSNETPPVSIFSQATFIGVFKLPEPF
ncbi:MAG: hypothetical protein FWH41_02255 [Treponema sp.]|nr:hypothetical protein [Treponema sp.]